MTTIAADSTLPNIAKSINGYIDTEIRVGMSLKVIYELSMREGSLPMHWIEPLLDPLSAISGAMQTAHDQTGNLAQFLVSINCFELNSAIADGSATIYSLLGIAHQVREKFAPGVRIPIFDYDTEGNPQVGALASDSFPVVRTVPQEANVGFTQKNVSATLIHIMQTSI